MGFFKSKKKEKHMLDKRNKFSFTSKSSRQSQQASSSSTTPANSTTPRTEASATPQSTPSTTPSKSISEQDTTSVLLSLSSPPRKKDILEDLNVVVDAQHEEQEDGDGGVELVLGGEDIIPSESKEPITITTRTTPTTETTTTTRTTPPATTTTPPSQTVAEVRNKKSVNRITVEQDITIDEAAESEIPTEQEKQEAVAMFKLSVQEKLKAGAVESKERMISQIKSSFDSADDDRPPQVYEDCSDSDSMLDVAEQRRVRGQTAAAAAAAFVTPEKLLSSLPVKSPMSAASQVSQTPFDQKAVPHPTFVGGEDPTIREQQQQRANSNANNSDRTRNMTPEAVAKKLLQAFTCTGDMLPEQVQKHMHHLPTNTCATDYTVVSTAVSLFRKGGVVPPKKQPLYNDQFAVKFLDVCTVLLVNK